MGLSIDVIRRVSTGSGHAVIADVTFDDSYPTGGESFTPADFWPASPERFLEFDAVTAQQKGVASRICQYDPATQKLKLFTALATEAANLSNQSSITVRALCVVDPAGLSS